MKTSFSPFTPSHSLSRCFSMKSENIFFWFSFWLAWNRDYLWWSYFPCYPSNLRFIFFVRFYVSTVHFFLNWNVKYCCQFRAFTKSHLEIGFFFYLEVNLTISKKRKRNRISIILARNNKLRRWDHKNKGLWLEMSIHIVPLWRKTNKIWKFWLFLIKLIIRFIGWKNDMEVLLLLAINNIFFIYLIKLLAVAVAVVVVCFSLKLYISDKHFLIN